MDMNQKELACAVAERSGLSREESADLSRAVLEAIAGQLSDGAARRLAAELPGVGEQCQPRRHRPEPRPVRLDEFITREADTPAGWPGPPDDLPRGPHSGSPGPAGSTGSS
jgi:uncharacterized protein (DUF2267 family)